MSFIYGDSVSEVVRHLIDFYDGSYTYVDIDNDDGYELVEIDGGVDIRTFFANRRRDDFVGCIAFRQRGDVNDVEMIIYRYDKPHRAVGVYLTPREMEYELVLFKSILMDVIYTDPFSDYDDIFYYAVYGL